MDTAESNNALDKVVSAKCFKDFDFYCELLVFGYCRTKSDREFARIEVPMDIINLCLIWFNPNTICLQCRTLVGKTFRVEINPKDTIFDIKFQVYEKEGLVPDQQELWLPKLGKLLKDDLKVNAYDLKDNAEIMIKIRIQNN